MKKILCLLSLTVVTGCKFPFFSKSTSSTTASHAVENASEKATRQKTGETPFIPGLVSPPQGEVPFEDPESSSSTGSPLSPIATSETPLSTSDATVSTPNATESPMPQTSVSNAPGTPPQQTIETPSPVPMESPQSTPTPSPLPSSVLSPAPPTPIPQTPPPDPTQVIIPISFPPLALYIDSKDQGKASVAESIDMSAGFLENGYALEITPTTGVSQGSVAVYVVLVAPQLPSSELSVFKKSPLVADWMKTDIQPSVSDGYARISIPLSNSNQEEYLLAGKEKPVSDTVTFENISPVSLPEDPLVTDTAQASNRARTASYRSIRRNIQSVVHPVIPDKDVIKDPANKKILAILVHGAGSETKFGYRWNPLKTFALTKSGRRQEVRDAFEFWSFQYDSTKEIAANAILLRDAIHAKFGARPYIIIAHSMGGLLAEFLYADEFQRNTFLGMITLGTPYHGSPFALPKMFREMLSHQALPTLKYTLYWGISNNFVSTIPSPTGEYRAIDPFTDFTPAVFTAGHRCLAFDGFDGEIPTRTYSLPFMVGEDSVRLTETLSMEDRLCVPCQYSKLYNYSGLTGIPHTSSFPCYFNFAEGLAKLKEYTGSGQKPHAFRYAGYFQELIDARYEKILLFDMALKNLNGVLHNRTETAEQQALRYAAMNMFSLPSVSGGIQSPFAAGDGLVPVSSALANIGRATIVDARSTNARLILDESAIQEQQPPDTLAYRLFPDYSHLDIVIGKSADDTRLFDSIVVDSLWLKSEYDKTLSYELSWGEINTLTEKTKKIVLLAENIDEPLVDGVRIRRATVISSQAVPSGSEQNRATVTLTVQKSVTVVKNNGSSYSEGVWNETNVATFGRINGVWYWIALQ